MMDEELTELECVIDDFCKEAVRNGFVLGDTCADCVLAAVASVCPTKRCDWSDALRYFADRGVADYDALDIARGYDLHPHGPLRASTAKFFAMGRRFRERVENGEYSNA